MNKLLVTLVDKKGKEAQPPMLVANSATAIRMLQNTLRDENAAEHQFVKTPEDFELHACGWFDIETGKISLLDNEETTIIIELKALIDKPKMPITSTDQPTQIAQ